jgi:hypothetical protein
MTIMVANIRYKVTGLLKEMELPWFCYKNKIVKGVWKKLL